MNPAVAILVPAYNPPAEFSSLLGELQAANPSAPIVVVDDGCSPPIDDAGLEGRGVTVIRHAQNRGKGAALKTGFDYISRHLTAVRSIVTVDADGQHIAEDVANVVSAASSNPGKLVLGVRDFSADVPLRSSFGNTITRRVFRLVTGTDIRDTQTGLRAYPVEFAIRCCGIGSDRYEFEMRSMLLAVETGMQMEQVAITTFYEEGNRSSHFRPFIDSMKVMAVFLRFAAVSAACFLIDIVTFFILYTVSGNIISSTYISRSLSATANFAANKLFVFKADDHRRTFYEVAGYVALALLIASLSAVLVDSLSNGGADNVVAIKIGVDCFLFVLSFLAQRHLLFRHREARGP